MHAAPSTGEEAEGDSPNGEDDDDNDGDDAGEGGDASDFDRRRLHAPSVNNLIGTPVSQEERDAGWTQFDVDRARGYSRMHVNGWTLDEVEDALERSSTWCNASGFNRRRLHAPSVDNRIGTPVSQEERGAGWTQFDVDRANLRRLHPTSVSNQLGTLVTQEERDAG